MELKKHQLKLSKVNFNDPGDKKHYNHILFNDVAPKYDRLTPMLSFGRDKYWKSYLISRLPDWATPKCLDLACGTGDITRALRRKFPDGQIIGLDLNQVMLTRAAKLAEGMNINFIEADINRTGLDDHAFDIITGGYALRNAPRLDKALKEIYRILKPGGKAVFMDFSKSRFPFIQAIQRFLLTIWGSFWGLVLHGSPDPYAYIAESLHHFPSRPELHRLLSDSGFKVVHSKLFFFGFIEIIELQK